MPEITLAEALNQTLKEQMRKDDRIVVLGEDIGKRGGVFLITEGLIDAVSYTHLTLPTKRIV